MSLKLYNKFGDNMKKSIPYILSLFIGTFFGYILFQDSDLNVKQVFANVLTVKAFQIGVFNSKEGALELKNKYEGSIVLEDEDVYRVYYSMLTNDQVIERMEKYLTNENISYYIKIITINDNSLIKAIEEYEEKMISGSDNVLISINKLIMETYEGGLDDN